MNSEHHVCHVQNVVMRRVTSIWFFRNTGLETRREMRSAAVHTDMQQDMVEMETIGKDEK